MSVPISHHCTTGIHVHYYRIRLCSLGNLGWRLARLHMEVSLHYGCQTLQGPLLSATKESSCVVEKLDEELVFKISICDIPVVSTMGENIADWTEHMVNEFRGKGHNNIFIPDYLVGGVILWLVFYT